jgi:hypothetical protein
VGKGCDYVCGRKGVINNHRYIYTNMPRKTKKEKELYEKLKAEHFSEDDKLCYIHLIDEHESLLYRVAIIPKKTKVFKLYGDVERTREDGSDDGFVTDYQKWKEHPDKGDVYAINLQNNDDLHSVHQYLTE